MRSGGWAWQASVTLLVAVIVVALRGLVLVGDASHAWLVADYVLFAWKASAALGYFWLAYSLWGVRRLVRRLPEAT